MKTVQTRDADVAAGFIRRGGIVAFPTETVYGLGADVFDEKAVAKIFEAKRRPADNPLIAHIADLEQIERIATEVTEISKKFLDAFFPGPLTIVLAKAAAVPIVATAGLETIGVRMPRDAAAQEFLRLSRGPVVAPSANISGRPSPTTWEAVYEDLDGRIDCILQGEPTEIGLESTVVDCTGAVPMVLRMGAISLTELRSVVPETCAFESESGEAPRSPGMRHKHYSPRARVLIVECGARSADLVGKTGNGSLESEIPDLTERAAFIGLHRISGPFEIERICPSVDEYAHSVFEFFRVCDRKGITTIVCEAVSESGIGAALMERLRLASEN